MESDRKHSLEKTAQECEQVKKYDDSREYFALCDDKGYEGISYDY